MVRGSEYFFFKKKKKLLYLFSFGRHSSSFPLRLCLAQFWRNNTLWLKGSSLDTGKTRYVFFYVAGPNLVPIVGIAPLGIGLLGRIYWTFWAERLPVVPMSVVTYSVFVGLFVRMDDRHANTCQMDVEDLVLEGQQGHTDFWVVSGSRFRHLGLVPRHIAALIVDKIRDILVALQDRAIGILELLVEFGFLISPGSIEGTRTKNPAVNKVMDVILPVALGSIVSL